MNRETAPGKRGKRCRGGRGRGENVRGIDDLRFIEIYRY